MNKLQHKKSKNFIYADENGVDVHCDASVLFKLIKYLLGKYSDKSIELNNKELKYRDFILDWMEWKFGCRCCALKGLESLTPEGGTFK